MQFNGLCWVGSAPLWRLIPDQNTSRGDSGAKAAHVAVWNMHCRKDPVICMSESCSTSYEVTESVPTMKAGTDEREDHKLLLWLQKCRRRFLCVAASHTFGSKLVKMPSSYCYPLSFCKLVLQDAVVYLTLWFLMPKTYGHVLFFKCLYRGMNHVNVWFLRLHQGS